MDVILAEFSFWFFCVTSAAIGRAMPKPPPRDPGPPAKPPPAKIAMTAAASPPPPHGMPPYKVPPAKLGKKPPPPPPISARNSSSSSSSSSDNSIGGTSSPAFTPPLPHPSAETWTTPFESQFVLGPLYRPPAGLCHIIASSGPAPERPDEPLMLLSTQDQGQEIRMLVRIVCADVVPPPTAAAQRLHLLPHEVNPGFSPIPQAVLDTAAG